MRRFFEKVYFPRLVVPISNMLCAAIQFGIQFLLVCAAVAYYTMQGAITPHFMLWPLLPVLLAVVGVMGMGVGVLISALTTKYRDLSVLVGFGLQLWMYATPVVYPASALPDGLSSILRWNPAAAPMELFRHIVLGTGTAEWGQMLLCTVFAAVCWPYCQLRCSTGWSAASSIRSEGGTLWNGNWRFVFPG